MEKKEIVGLIWDLWTKIQIRRPVLEASTSQVKQAGDTPGHSKGTLLWSKIFLGILNLIYFKLTKFCRCKSVTESSMYADLFEMLISHIWIVSGSFKSIAGKFIWQHTANMVSATPPRKNNLMGFDYWKIWSEIWRQFARDNVTAPEGGMRVATSSSASDPSLGKSAVIPSKLAAEWTWGGERFSRVRGGRVESVPNHR